jgi:mRNA interferase HigB
MDRTSRCEKGVRGVCRFFGDNRLIFDIAGNTYRLIVHVADAHGRMFVGSQAGYDRIDPETV